MVSVQWPPADPGWPAGAVDETQDAVSSRAEAGVAARMAGTAG